MDFWQRARTFAEEAAKRSQEFTKEAAKRSQEFTKEAAKRSQELTIGSSRLSDVVSEASKRSKELAAEASKRSKEIVADASKRADQIKVEALKRAEQIKSQIPASALTQLVDSSSTPQPDAASPAPGDLEKYGVTDDLREFVKGITRNTFQDFPLEDDSEMSDIPTVSNVRQDLTKWQEKHAKLVLLTVKEISKLRYELCPRMMKERKFWRIYFILVNSHVAPYEKKYMEEEKLKSAEKAEGDVAKEGTSVGTTSKAAAGGTNQKIKSTTSSISEQDLDVFLLGDLEDGDEGPDDGNDDFDDDFDKI